MTKKPVIVGPSGDGRWTVKSGGSPTPKSTHQKQSTAIDKAERIAKDQKTSSSFGARMERSGAKTATGVTRILRKTRNIENASMAYTIPVAFDTFISNIALSGDHRDTAEKRRERLVSLLEGSFTVLDTILAGSIPHGTAVAGAADLDIITVLHYGKHIKGKSPKAVLESIRDALAGSSKIVKKNGQAVTLYYTKWPNVDVVPASRVDNSDGTVSHYNIPDMNRGVWLQTRPRRHNKAMAALSARQRQLIQMLKCWNSAHSSIMQSYHLAVLVMSLPDVTCGWPYEVRTSLMRP